ncbi:hypothetical protein HZS_334 [Henneguya salminicola]|nr:hypothetical protein HZS_334 [Henneguya salminicola]
MLFDNASDLHIQCIFSIVTGKKEHIYWEFLSQVIMLLEYNKMPKIRRIIGCYFHVKQDLHRKLKKKYRVSSTSYPIILSKRELITNIQIVQINQAIGYIQSLTTAEDTLNQFLDYFNRTWVVRSPLSLCHISAGMVNRTNNALERYNRRLNDFCANVHPNICSFIEIIKDEFLYFEERYAEVSLNSYSGILTHNKIWKSSAEGI